MQSNATTCNTASVSSKPTIEDIIATAGRLRLYLRPDEAAAAIGVSRRTLSAWQSARVIPFRRVGRTVLFAVADIQRALDRFTVAAIGEPPTRSATPRKRRAGRIPAPTSDSEQHS
jgi:excisionase family DNA binding protein